jgi:hypothetical protein
LRERHYINQQINHQHNYTAKEEIPGLVNLPGEIPWLGAKVMPVSYAALGW